MWNEELQGQYDALIGGRGYVVLNDFFVVQLTGADRQAFLHSFCTADIKQLAAGTACEAFVLNGKGKVLAFVHVLAFEDAMWLVAAGREQSQTLIDHLDRYIIREDVQLADLSDSQTGLFAPAMKTFAQIGATLAAPNECQRFSIEQTECRAATIELAGRGVWLACANDNFERVASGLAEQHVAECDAVVLESVRLECPTPRNGSEANETNLPQELQRDEIAISFTKGCYLGQETVARLDALGRVNQLLMPVALSELPSGSEVPIDLFADEKPAGKITSIAWSPSRQKWLGLGMVRRTFAQPGAQLTTSDGVAVEVAERRNA